MFANNYDISSAQNILFYSIIHTSDKGIKDLKINYTKFCELLKLFGFRRFDFGKSSIIVQINKNIIEEVNLNRVQDVFFNFLNSLPEILSDNTPRSLLVEIFNKNPEQYFNPRRISLLTNDKEFDFVKDSKNAAYLFYKNGFVVCNSAGWQLHDYSELSNYIWKNQILKREFEKVEISVENASKSGIFSEFIWKIANQNEERFSSICSIIGYSLHTYFEGKLKAVILTDSKISEVPDGRTGKSLLAKAFSMTKKSCNIKGKDFKQDEKFKYQEIDLDTQIVILDDIHARFNFENMFNDITEGIKVEKKNQDPFSVLCKIIITTNRTVKIEGASARDRSIEFEFADYYNETLSPQDDFGKWFFSDEFTKEDWNLFDNYMLFCLSYYLKYGIKIVPSINLNRRKLLEATCQEFVEFMDTFVKGEGFEFENDYLKKSLHEDFLKDYSDFQTDKYFSKLRNFTSCLRLYAELTPEFSKVNKDSDERKSGSNRYIRFKKAIISH